MSDIDRFDAEVLADLLSLPVDVIPGDDDTLTAALWELLLPGEQMPEAVSERWEIILAAYLGGGLLGDGPL